MNWLPDNLQTKFIIVFIYNFMLWTKYPDRLDSLSLTEAYADLEGDSQAKIPWLVWLLENPASPISLPGSIDLYGHDCLHLLLKKGFRSTDEAYIVGFTMGNDINTNRFHLLIIKVAAYILYPKQYKLTFSELKRFDLGVRQGRKSKFRNINKINWNKWSDKKLRDIRVEIGLESEAKFLITGNSIK